VGDGYYESFDYNKIWHRSSGIPLIFKYAVSGSSLNDIVICGDFGFFSHYNGYTWRHFYTNTDNHSIKIKKDIVICVGSDGRKAQIVYARR
jgi:hypothetical protein